MVRVVESAAFKAWAKGLTDPKALAKVRARIERLKCGNPGDVAPVGEGVSELRIHYGPGYRVYYLRSGKTMYLLLCGGDKSTQQADIARSKAMAADLQRKG